MNFSKYILQVFLILGGIVITQAQTLKGKIVEQKTQEPIAYATVFLLDLQIGVLTDQDGFFEYANQLPRETKLKVTAFGFETQIIRIALPLEESLVIELNEMYLELNEITVSTTTGTIQKYSTTNIESKSIKEITQLPTSTLGEAISNIPSVYQTTNGVGISKPVIRGLSGTRVVTYLNGLRIENQQWAGDHGMGVTENGIGSLEVIKGPSSLLYGAAALGGVIYFMDEPYAQHNHFESFVESRFESNSLGTKNYIGLKWAKNNLRVNVFGNFSNQADFKLPNGKFAKNSRFEEQNFKTSIGYNKKNWVLNIRYNYLNNRIGLPGHTHDTLVVPETFQTVISSRENAIPVQLISNLYTLIENIFYFKNSDLKIWLGNTYNRLQEYEEKVTIPGLDNVLWNNTYNIRYKKNLTEKTNFILGAQGMAQNNRNGLKALDRLLPDANIIDNGIYSLVHTEWKKWELQTGIRVDNRTINTLQEFKGNALFSNSYSGINYSAGASKIFKKYLFRINASSGFRPPHLSELMSNGFHHGALRYEIGDINLKSETATQIDITTEYSADHLRLIFNPFYQRIQNYIFIEPTNLSVDNLPLFYYKQTPFAELYGGDFGIHFHPHFAHKLHFEQNVSYIFAQDQLQNPLPLIPQTRFNSTLRFEINNKGKIEIENIAFQHLYFLDQTRVVAFETPSIGYQIVNLATNIKINFKNPMYIKIGIKNLFNQEYIDHLSRLKNIGLPNPGRNFFIGVRLNMNKKITVKPLI